MKQTFRLVPLATVATVLLAATSPADPFPPTPVAHGGARVSVVATGLDDPRGLVLGPRGDLFVAEAGTTEGVFVPPPPPEPTEPPTRERCEVYWPVGPSTPGFTGRISRIGAGGVRTTVADGLPSFGANTLIGGDRMGVGAVAFSRGRLHAILAGGGCSHGHLSHPNAVLRVERGGDVVTVADLSEHLRANEDSKDPADGDFEPDGVWYNLVSAFGGLYAVEPNRGVFVRIDADGSVTRVADMIAKVASIDPAGNGDKTFSALAVRGCWFYFGTLGRIDKDTLAIEPVATGLHGVLGLAFDRRGRLHALETTAAGVEPPLSNPTAGRLVRIERDGSLTPVVTNLAFPTALLAGRRGELYVSNCGYHCDDRSAFPATLPSLRSGQILKVVTR
jgi:hypothetical protein